MENLKSDVIPAQPTNHLVPNARVPRVEVPVTGKSIPDGCRQKTIRQDNQTPRSYYRILRYLKISTFKPLSSQWHQDVYGLLSVLELSV